MRRCSWPAHTGACCRRTCRAETSLLRLVPRSPYPDLLEPHDHLSVRGARFHHAMGLANVLETKDPCRPGLIDAGFDPLHEGLHWNFRSRKLGCAEHEAAEEAEVHAARELHHGHE